jgi:ubiquinol-cytochrome c reductase cytochrome c subunit
MAAYRALRGIVATLGAALAFAAASHGARAADPVHPLIPSHRDVNPGTLYDAGTRLELPVGVPRATLLAEGAALYDTHCSTCHGAQLRGSQGVPALLHEGGAATDFYMTTGRMPLAVRGSAPADASNDAKMASGTQAFHDASHFDARQTAAIELFVDAHAGPSAPIPSVRTDVKRLAHGRLLFEDNCEACHGVAGEGATAGYQWTALPLDRATPTQIGEAIRVGPGVMPRFTTAQLSDDDVDAVATYVRYLATAPQTYGGTTMDYLGPSAEGFVAIFIGVGFLFWVVYFTGTKEDGRRVHQLDE